MSETAGARARAAGPSWQRSFSRRMSRYVDRHFALLMTLPAVITVSAVTLVPIIVAVGYSFTNFNLTFPSRIRFIGLENYAALLTDPDLKQVMGTTSAFVVLMVGSETVLGLGLALLLARPFRGLAAYRVLYTA